jgi:phage tail-like protein
MSRAVRLDHNSGWRVEQAAGIAMGRDGLMLAPVPAGGQQLGSADGSLGGAARPARLAAGPAGSLFLITGDHRLLAYDPCTERFTAFPCAEPPPGLTQPQALAVHPAGDLYVLDGASGAVTVLSIASGQVRRRFGPFAVSAAGVVPLRLTMGFDPLTGAPDGSVQPAAGAWDAIDIAVLSDGRIAVSTGAEQLIVLFDRRGRPCGVWTGQSDEQPPLKAPSAIAALADGGMAVLEQGGTLAVLDKKGRITARIGSAGDLDFAATDAALAVDADGTIWISDRRPDVPDSLRCCPGGRPGAGEPVRLVPGDCALLAFDSDGHAILGGAGRPCLIRSTTIHRMAAGELVTVALDSGGSGTQWDVIDLDCAIPMGSVLTVETFTSDAPLDTATRAREACVWASTPLTRADRGRAVVAVRSPPGRYLWLRLRLAGDGAVTPVLNGVTLAWPRMTSARYLPGTYSAEPVSGDFLARFLGMFDQLRSDMLAPIDDLPALFDPMATPAAEAGASGDDFLDWLAGWIGLALDRNWSVERRRRLVRDAPALYRIRGTVEGLKRHVAVYTGIAPRIVEHYRLRHWLALDETALDANAGLWGPEIVRRLQLDSYSEVGSFALVDGGDPLTDPVGAFAHRASLYIPVSDGFSPADEAALADVVEVARPAHVAVDIHLMRPRFVIGCDLLLGVNTIFGSPVSPARADESRLGEDIRLSGPPHGFTLRQGVRLGADTQLD